MASQNADFTPVRLSTAWFPERDGLPAWLDFYGPRFLRLEIEPTPDTPFYADVTVRSVPAIKLVSAVMSPARLSRTPALLVDDNDDVVLLLSSSVGLTSQRGRELSYGVGDADALSAGEAGTTVWPSTSRHLCVHITRAALAPLVPDLDDAVVRRIPFNSKPLQYLLSYSRFLEQQHLGDAELARVAALHLRDLLALTLGATGNAAVVGERRGLPTARLEAIKADIAKHLDQPGFTVSDAAAHQRVTPRYVQFLFESEGTTFSEFLLSRRLARARRMLVDRRYTGWTVSAIALESGFGDVSYFNRSFRRRFGASPTQFRSTARA